MSTNWCVAIEYWRSSSIEVIFVDYQTSKLQCNYQSYIQICTIEDACGFSGIASIAPSEDFSVKTLTGVQLYHERPSWIGVSLLQKIESLDCCITTVWVCYKKDGCHRRQAFSLDVDKEYYYRNVFSEQMDLTYNKKLYPHI